MGTNYYLTKTLCKHCNSKEVLHIGKSSAGWYFLLHVIPFRGINDLEDWTPLFDKFPISNEYDEIISKEEMMKIITERKWKSSFLGPSLEDFLSHNPFAEVGINNLVRMKIGNHCLKHGKGTWDCCVGEFS